METLVISLVVAAVSAITFLAYRHPAAYSRIHMPIFCIVTLAAGLALSWNSAISIASTKILAAAPSGTSYQPVIDAVSDLGFGGFWLGIVIYGRSFISDVFIVVATRT